MARSSDLNMTSHEKREDVLRRAEARRRTSFLLPDDTAGAQDAATVLDIRNIPQLQHWVAKEPAAVMSVLIELRQERDAALSCIEEWDTMAARNDEAMEATRAAQAQRRAAQDKYRTIRQENIQLENHIGRLEVQVADLEADAARRQATPSSTLGGGKHRTAKTSDPPLFCEAEGDITLDDWTQRIRDKLTVNRDHFEDDMAKTIYVISRTGGTAAEQIHSYRVEDPNYFTTPEELLDMLQDVMGNPNKRADMRRELKALKMKTTETFAAFLPKFRRYVTYLKLGEETMVEELTEKIIPRLQRAIATNPVEFKTLRELGAYCQKVDNRLRHVDTTHEREKETSNRSTTSSANASKTPRTTAYVPPPKRSVIEPAVVVTPRRTVSPQPLPGRCHNCNKEGHWAKDCPNPKKETIRKIGSDSKDSASSADELEGNETELEGQADSEN